MTLTVRCPQCGNSMKYQPSKTLAGKSKQCVYCGRSFRVKDRITSGVSKAFSAEFQTP
ncbi:MAG: hypothetical protein AABY13_00985 [Nanoarchaeota archaeon]